VICPSCKFANAAVARFCGGCGGPVVASAGSVAEAERRHLFVLFCDIVGSTPLSMRLDAEDLRDVVGAYQRACGAVVLRHDGFVAQYFGDGIEVYFGYPLAHEDDASRVVRCAFEMLGAVQQLAIASKVDFQVRIGIHSGRVVVGTLGDGNDWRNPVAIGDTPNIAARIQAEAGPGEVVVSGSLWRLLPGTFAAEPMGFRKLKGVERPVELFKVVATGGQTAGLNTRRTPFIGRVGERDRLREVWARAKSGEPQFALVRGEPGIGKSRLLDLARSEIADDGGDVMAARCTPDAADTALYPVIELLGLRLGFDSVPAEERVARVAERMTELELAPKEAVPLLSSILSLPVDNAEWPAPDLSPARARQRTMDIIIEAIHALTRRSPVVLIVEDLHWADPSSLELLRQLIAAGRKARMMALLTARPEFKPTWVAATNLTLVELDALDPAEAETVIRKVARDKPLPPALVWQIRERAAGNPLFLEEITRSVTESGALAEREHSWELVGKPSPEVVPTSMEASLMARIDRLGEARSLLQLGATLGREFSHDLLVAVAESPEDTVRRQLDLMLESGLIFRQGIASPVYSFKHALVRDAAYDSLLRTTRQRYHARIAEALITHFPGVAQTRPELLARHLSGAGSHAEAASYWRTAGERAVERGAMNEAVAHLRHALADLEFLAEDAKRMDQELSVLTALAPAQMAVYGWAPPEVGETCKRAIHLAGQLGAHERIVPPLWGLWTNQFTGGRLSEALETVTQFLSRALASNNPMLKSIAYGAMSYTRYYRGEFDDSIADAQLGLDDCSYDVDSQICQLFQVSAKSTMLTTKGSSLWMQGQQDEGIAIIIDLIAYTRSLRHPPVIATGLASAMFFSLYDRDWKRLFAFADEVHDLSRAEGFAMWIACAGMHRGRARMGLGEMDAGAAEVLEWGALFRQTGQRVIEGSTASMISEALHWTGRSEEALVVSREGERHADRGLVRVMEPEIYRTRGDILRDLDRLDQADQAYREALACARAQGARSLELRALTSLLDLRLSRGRQPNDLPAKLRRTMAAMACQPDRPDLMSARELLARVHGSTSPCKEPECH